MRLIPILTILGLTGCLIKKPPEPAVPTSPDATPSATAPATGAPAGATPVVPVAKTPEQIALERQQKAREATALLTSGKYEDARRALTLLQELEKDLPESAAVLYDLGLAQQQLGNKAVAEQSYRRVTQLDPSFGKAWLALGTLAENGGDLGYALTVYGQGMRAAPDDMELCTARIGVLMKLGRNEEAEAAAKQALQINAKAQSIYANLAMIYLQVGKLELGKFIIQRAFNFVEGAENNADLHASLGRIYYLQQHSFEARTEYERALQLDPQLLSAMVYLAELHLDNRAFSSMVPLLEKAVKLAPEDPAIHMNLGIAYRGVQRYEDAEREYDRVAQLKPGSGEPLLNKAILYGDYQKRYPEAMAILDQYKALPTADVAQADAWIEQYEKEKERVERADRRRKAAEERRRKREEEERFLKEMEEKKRQEELLLQQQEAAQPPEPEQPAAGAAGAMPATPGQPSGDEQPEGSSWGQPTPTPTPEGAAPTAAPAEGGTAPAAPLSNPAEQPPSGAPASGQEGSEEESSEQPPSTTPASPWGALEPSLGGPDSRTVKEVRT